MLLFCGLALAAAGRADNPSANTPASSAPGRSVANLIDDLLKESQAPSDLSKWVILGVNPPGIATAAAAQQQAKAIRTALSDVSYTHHACVMQVELPTLGGVASQAT
jgi:hypothetical protein